MLSHEETLQYLELRKEGKIGKLWTEGERIYKLAPLEALAGLEYQLAESICEEKLVILIRKLSGLEVERKPIVSEWDSIVRRFKAG